MQYKKWKSKPFVSALLVAVNVVIFIICTFTGDMLYNMGRNDVIQVVFKKEYMRIFSSMFLHGDIQHLFNNMLILFFMGAMIEKEIGHILYTIAYFISGVGGNILSLFVKYNQGDLSGSIGASGAIFGLDGILLAMVLFWNKRLDNVTPIRVALMIGFSLYSGFTSHNIDNAAHIGGLVTGFLLGLVMCFIQRRTGGNAFEH